MNFKQLYTDSKSQIAEAIIGMWKENAPKMVERYSKQLDNIISKCISDNIVVENMAKWTPSTNDEDWRKIINDKIWRTYDKNGNIIEMKRPHAHQYNSWKALLEDDKSIVVTSGTGSGKTECFMVPLVHDLTKNQTCGRTEAVEAIFLYPLNALMEDQKERINKYIEFSEKELKFAVYNGNTPERYSDNENGFENEIVSREEIRKEKPNILFTNPSMLEYMLLRKIDSELFTSSLKWIVIDETHTYKGSAGAELAMLIRRILKACNKNATEIKFATSSATIGSDEAAQKDLVEFISQITGQPKEQIAVIEGFRTEPKAIADDKKKLLNDKNFVLLKDLIPEGTIEEKLEKLDELANTENGLRVRLHYYLQTLNQGLYVNPCNVRDGEFLLSRCIPLDENGKLDMHYLDAYYCKECGAILGYGELDDDKQYHRITKDEVAALEDSNTDDDSDDENDTSSTITESHEFYIGLHDAAEDKENQNSLRCTLDDDIKVIPSSSGEFKYKKIESNNKGEVIHYCPCCGAKGNNRNKPMKSFRMSADFISRLIAPILLKQTSPATKDANTLPSQGHKYITFADSRQSVAGPTLKQNLETEEVWVTGVLYQELNNILKAVREDIKESKDLIEFYKDRGNYEKYKEQEKKLDKLQDKLSNGCYITWNEALDILLKDVNCERMFLAFAKPNDNRNSSSERKKAKKEYILSALYRVMNRRLAKGKNCPENWGLMCTYYPDLESLSNRELPDSIKNFNKIIDDNLAIKPEDWYNYVKIFIDYDIRRHERFFFKSDKDDWDEIDYSTTRQYRTGVSSRRPIDGEESEIKAGDNRYTKLLLNLLNKKSYTELQPNEKDCVTGVIAQLKSDIEDCKIKEKGEELNWKYDENRKEWYLPADKKWEYSKKDKNTYNHYMNLARIAFRLYDNEVWFDENLRIPVDTTFKGYSPERNDATQQYDTKCKKTAWPQYDKDSNSSTQELFEKNRNEIKHKWTSKLERILDYSSNNPNTLYIQAEHTAQVARNIIKDQTDKFKKGDINIMACSTTMEMGVDLGDLEMVVMNNVPPHPANYKQRAGRAGRGDQNKSSAITICGCDASGEAMMQNPLTSLICAPIEPPKVNISKTPQLVQRHINSFLFRKFITDEEINFSPGGEGENDRGYKVYDLFTTYMDICLTKHGSEWIKRARKEINDNSSIWPNEYESFINDTGSYYNRFIGKLDLYAKDDRVIEEIRDLANGALYGDVTPVKLIEETKKKIKKIAEALDKELQGVCDQWKNAKCNPCEPNNGQNNPWKIWNYRFTSILNANLLSYLSTHQFTPNANMPVGIVEMVIDERERHSTDNPSRDMKTALSEYTPGRKVFINGATYLMGGVKWNHSQANKRLKKCCNNHTWTDDAVCPKCQQQPVEWGDGFGTSIEVITPTGFYPHKETSRITHKESLELVLDTALIGVGDWKQQDVKRLYMTRTNEDDVNSEIFYYNKGLGHGYYVCKECGYAVPMPSSDNSTETFKKSLYPIESKRESYHNYRWKCSIKESDNLEKKAFRNIVFGGAIQTDYCEIALFDDANHQMKYDNNNNEANQIAHTLGLMLCREFTHRIGCERSEVEFIVRRQNMNVSICIFDVAKGGVGYSKRLQEGHLIDTLFDHIREQLKECKSADKILDRTTMKYADKINVQATLKWLEKEYLFRDIVPQEIKDLLPNKKIRVSSYQEVENAIINIQNGEQCVLFFNGERINIEWNFNAGEVNWQNNRGELNKSNYQQKIFAVYNLPHMITPNEEICMQIASQKTAWKTIDNPLTNLFPIAQIGSTLYFTNKNEYAALNGLWATDNIYSVDYTAIPLNDISYIQTGDEHYTYPGGLQCYSDELFAILYENSERLRDFIEVCNGNNLKFEYHEEYLRTHLGMTITLQFIKEFATKANAKIEHIKITGEKYDESSKLKPKLYDWNTSQPRYLYANCLDDKLRDMYLRDTFMNKLCPDTASNYTVESIEKKMLPHWRSIRVTDTTTGAAIMILPNGGFANGLEYENREYRQGGFYNSNCDINTRIPIKVVDRNGLLYDIKVEK